MITRLESISHGELPSSSSLTRYFRSSSSLQNEARAQLARNFERASEATAHQLEKLVNEAEVNLVLLNRMDESQNTLNEMIQMEDMDVKETQDRLDHPSVRINVPSHRPLAG